MSFDNRVRFHVKLKSDKWALPRQLQHTCVNGEWRDFL